MRRIENLYPLAQAWVYLPASMDLMAFFAFIIGIGQFIPDVSMVSVAMLASLSFVVLRCVPERCSR